MEITHMHQHKIVLKWSFGKEIEVAPVSPIGQYFNSSVLSIAILAVLEIEIPFDDTQTMSLLKDVFLPNNPRLSSIMTINDVIAGVIFLGTRMYMQAEISKKSSNDRCTALVLMNTRNTGDYMSIKEMIQPNNAAVRSWGNRFGFLHISLPESTEASNPLDFVWEAQKIVKRKRSSAAVYLTSRLLDILNKFKGPEAAARYIHSTLKKSSMAITNMIGPVEQMALANHPIRGFYFMVVGSPESLTITAASYMGKIRLAFEAEKGFIDSQKFKACVETAFGKIVNATNEIPTLIA